MNFNDGWHPTWGSPVATPFSFVLKRSTVFHPLCQLLLFLARREAERDASSRGRLAPGGDGGRNPLLGLLLLQWLSEEILPLPRRGCVRRHGGAAGCWAELWKYQCQRGINIVKRVNGILWLCTGLWVVGPADLGRVEGLGDEVGQPCNSVSSRCQTLYSSGVTTPVSAWNWWN